MAMLEPQYTGRNIYAVYNKQVAAIEKRKRIMEAVNHAARLGGLSSTKFRSNQAIIDDVGSGELDAFSKQMKLLSAAEQTEISQALREKLLRSTLEGDLKTKKMFDQWMLNHGPAVADHYDDLLVLWRKGQEEVRQEEKYSKTLKTAQDVDDVSGWVNELVNENYERYAYTVGTPEWQVSAITGEQEPHTTSMPGRGGPTYKGQRDTHERIRLAVRNNQNIPKHLKTAVIEGATKMLEQAYKTEGRFDARDQELQEAGELRNIEKFKREILAADVKATKGAEETVIDDNTRQMVERAIANVDAGRMTEPEARKEAIRFNIGTKYNTDLFDKLWKNAFPYAKKPEDENTRKLARAVAERVDKKGETVRQAKESILNSNSKKENPLEYNPILFNDLIKERLGKDPEPTAALKALTETETLLASGDPNDLDRAMDMEMSRGAQLTPLWHKYAINEKRGIAIENILRTLKRVSPERFKKREIQEGDQSFEITLDQESLRSAWVEAIEEMGHGDQKAIPLSLYKQMIQDAANRLNVPIYIVEYILFPEKFRLGE